MTVTFHQLHPWLPSLQHEDDGCCYSNGSIRLVLPVRLDRRPLGRHPVAVAVAAVEVLDRACYGEAALPWA